MKISSEFSKHALHYDTYNVIQNRVIEKLLSLADSKPLNILDLGCGNGSLCKAIDWEYEHFTGVDFAPGMLELHPKSNKIECIYGDFNDKVLFENLLTYKYDYVFSASALQWAKDLDMVFKNIKKLNAPIALAIFTSNTFKTLNETASINSLLRSADEVNRLQKKYFDVNFEVVNYKLEFESTRDMFRYIKKSGVSGARKILSFKESKKLLNEYPKNYLEFEVAFIYN
ncbi:MAG: methyltransferase domain-containing protein [Sulfurimonas sp.]|uniref:methyltransferase domain-containing protein n=1 Tax=Sulfurimonas sp. TaxID=2022749 RepID=UPI00260B0273|nr:methyltransferase domain-containing protein [Sulfurimonas sp.]MCW8896240.1 methyltransferase domain-containing protein [Sulfurimonas sp.]MCW8953426.1 methyltransferase domain-containing protein [Sulfurimonas sp.]MCW9068467.1 methyltransferase domain-containing protein [Sulfurimonas sp.]